MKYSKKDIAIGFVIIILIILGALYYKKSKNKPVPTATPTTISFLNEIEDSFKYNIPENSNSIELKDVSGGDGRGIATEKEILVDIKDPDKLHFYEAWLLDGDKTISLGKLNQVKGGWLLEYDKSKFPNTNTIIVSLESKYDSLLETKILEGTFN